MSQDEAADVAVGARVHLRSDWPEPWPQTDEVVEFNGAPVEYEVTAVEPEHEVEVTGGTATILTRVTVRPTGRPGLEQAVPIGRVVLPGAALRPHP